MLFPCFVNSSNLATFTLSRVDARWYIMTAYRSTCAKTVDVVSIFLKGGSFIALNASDTSSYALHDPQHVDFPLPRKADIWDRIP